MRKYFGTDGIRGQVGRSFINPEFILKLGWAAGKVLGQRESGVVLIGKDTRVSGYMLEAALQAGLSASGTNIKLLGPMPTPAIAYLTRSIRASAAIVISASHNPYQDNGIKFFDQNGFKLSDALEAEIEDHIDMPLRTAPSESLGKASRMTDAQGRYIEFCKSTFPSSQNLKGLTIVVDCAHGATYHIAPALLHELGATVHPISVHPDGFNINRQCGATDPRALQRAVVDLGADLGIAYDGDGDRLILVDHQGEIVDGDEILGILTLNAHRAGRLTPGGVVGTVMSNFGLEQALQTEGIPFTRAPVGDRYVLERMLAVGSRLGGESSGHLVNLDYTTTGDGIITSLQILRILQETGNNLHTLKRCVQKYPQVLLNVPTYRESVCLSEFSMIQTAVQAAEQQLGQEGRVLLRPSGTEPLVRVMVEGVDARRLL